MLSEGYRKDDQKEPISGDMVVHFFLQGGYRARHMDDTFFDYIKQNGIESEDGTQTKIKFKEVFLDKKWR
jgi:5,10-methenyltetrahydromethanopterin hydrogenase